MSPDDRTYTEPNNTVTATRTAMSGFSNFVMSTHNSVLKDPATDHAVGLAEAFESALVISAAPAPPWLQAVQATTQQFVNLNQQLANMNQTLPMLLPPCDSNSRSYLLIARLATMNPFITLRSMTNGFFWMPQTRVRGILYLHSRMSG